MGAKRIKALPSVDRLRDCFLYDPKSGSLTWATRTGRATYGYPAGKQNGDYLTVQLDKAGLLVHRVCWAMMHGHWPDWQIDHINGNKLDNRAENLREATHSENMRNRIGWGKSKIKGVCWIKKDKRWRASLGVGKSVKYLGQYERLCDAVHAHRRAAQGVQGNFALHNRSSVMQLPFREHVSQSSNPTE